MADILVSGTFYSPHRQDELFQAGFDFVTDSGKLDVSTTSLNGKIDRIWIHNPEDSFWLCIMRDGHIIFGEPCA